MFCGGGLSGFLACRDEEKYLGEHPSHLISIAHTEREGEYAFWHCRTERTSYIGRDKAKDWVGTTSLVGHSLCCLFGIDGTKRYDGGWGGYHKEVTLCTKLLSEIEGVKIPFSTFFKEFVVKFETGKTVRDVNKALLKRGILGGKDIAGEFSEFGQSALCCVTEIHSEDDILKLANTLREVLA